MEGGREGGRVMEEVREGEGGDGGRGSKGGRELRRERWREEVRWRERVRKGQGNSD